MEQRPGTGCPCSEGRFSLLSREIISHFSVLLSLHFSCLPQWLLPFGNSNILIF